MDGSPSNPFSPWKTRLSGNNLGYKFRIFKKRNDALWRAPEKTEILSKEQKSKFYGLKISVKNSSNKNFPKLDREVMPTGGSTENYAYSEQISRASFIATHDIPKMRRIERCECKH